MEPDSIELGFLSVFALITFFIFLIIEKNLKKINNVILLDEDFIKPQAFHVEPISRSGGIGCFATLMIFIEYIICFMIISYMNISLLV